MTSLKEIEKKYYPIYWRIVTDNEDDIEIKDNKYSPDSVKVSSSLRYFLTSEKSKKLNK